MTYGAVPQGINTLGQVVGYYNASAASGSQVPFVYTPGVGAVALTQVTPGFTTAAAAINDTGLVVGSGQIGTDINGFVYNSVTNTFSGLTSGSVTGNGTNTVTKTFLSAVNNTGTAVGYVGYDGVNATTRAYRGMTYNTLTNAGQDVGSSYSGVVVTGNSATNQNIFSGINDNGVIVGYGPNTGGASGTGTVNNTQSYFKATPTGTGTYTYTDLTPAIKAADSAYGGISGGIQAIDALGDAAGTYRLSSATLRKGFFYNAATDTALTFNLPGSNNATGVSSLGLVNGVPVVGGSASIAGQPRHGFYFQNGVLTDISGALAGTAFSGFTINDVNGINANGDIVVTAASSSGVPNVFVLSGFVPEPASLGLLALGGIVLLRRGRRVSLAG